MAHHNSLRSGFTILEISIVVMAIGMVLGILTVARDMREGANKRAVISEWERYSTAIINFSTKYNCFPGDCSNAYSLFGATCGTNASTVNTGCNGDGSDRIEYNGVGYGLGEHLKLWKHLHMANLTDRYSNGQGTLVSGIPEMVAGTNIPDSAAYKNAGWTIGYATLGHMAGVDFPTHGFVYAGETSNGSAVDIDFVLTEKEAELIDSKADDGIAGSGMIRGDSRSGCESTTGYIGGNPDDFDCTMYFQLK